MRITNAMTTNKMMLNINKNAGHLDKLYTQMGTGKKIQVPSDDPIIAARALKFRTSIEQTEQYKRNVAQGLSWLQISEKAFSNINEITETIGERCVAASTDTLEAADRQKIAEEIRALAEQIGFEMNVQYTGRYVFAGLKTDTPPVIDEDEVGTTFDIEQHLKFTDIEEVIQYSKTALADVPVVTESVNRLKLPYVSEMSNVVIFEEKAEPKSKNDKDAYDFSDSPHKAHYIKETGEIIISDEFMEEIRKKLDENAKDDLLTNDDIPITYTKAGIKAGELNPRIYFNCTETTPDKVEKVYSQNNQELKFEFGVNTRIQVNNLASDTYPAAMYANLMALSNELNRVAITDEVTLNQKYYSTPPYDAMTKEEQDNLKAEQIKEEEQIYRGVLQKMFSNMIEINETFAQDVSEEETVLGSRIVRLNLIDTRLDADKINFTDLMSKNEDADYLETSMKFNSEQAIYQAALNVGAKIMQLTLIDFVR